MLQHLLLPSTVSSKAMFRPDVFNIQSFTVGSLAGNDDKRHAWPGSTNSNFGPFPPIPVRRSPWRL